MIDALYGGNNARWISHGCEPNCEAEETDAGRVFIPRCATAEPGEGSSTTTAWCWTGATRPSSRRSSPASAAPPPAVAPCWRPSADRTCPSPSLRDAGSLSASRPTPWASNAPCARGGGPLLLVADRQTNGQGRQGRSWISIPGGSLTCSFALALPARRPLRSVAGRRLRGGRCARPQRRPHPPEVAQRPVARRRQARRHPDRNHPLPEGQRGVVIGLGLNLAPLPLDADRSAMPAATRP